MREEKGRWVASITAPGPDGAPRSLDVYIAPQPSGSIIVEAYERQDMRLCSADELPEWAGEKALR